MAIQSRRGPFSKFVPSKLKSAEVAFVESSDPTSKDGYGIYIGTPGDKAVQIARQDSVADTAAEVFEQIADSISDAEAKRVTAEKGRVSAEAARVSAEKAREAAQAKNNADQAQNNAAAKGMTFHVCGTSEYKLDSEGAHNVPTLTAKTGVMYLTPKVSVTEESNRYEQWMYVGDAWELMGEEKHIDPVTTGDVDSIVAGTSVAADRYLNAAGLTYWWLKAKAKLGELFAPLSHKHAASDVTSGTLPIARGGTGASTAAVALTALGAASASDLTKLGESVFQAKNALIKSEDTSVAGYVGVINIRHDGFGTTDSPHGFVSDEETFVQVTGFLWANDEAASAWPALVKAPWQPDDLKDYWCVKIPIEVAKKGAESIAHRTHFDRDCALYINAKTDGSVVYSGITTKRLFASTDGYIYIALHKENPPASPAIIYVDTTVPLSSL